MTDITNINFNIRCKEHFSEIKLINIERNLNDSYYDIKNHLSINNIMEEVKKNIM